MKKNIEKIRDGLYVKNLGKGRYEVVYPLKDEEGNKIKGNLKKAFMSDLKESIGWIIPLIVLLIFLLPNAYEIKTSCEQAIKELQSQEVSCKICNGGYDDYGLNITLPESNYEKLRNVIKENE